MTDEERRGNLNILMNAARALSLHVPVSIDDFEHQDARQILKFVWLIVEGCVYSGVVCDAHCFHIRGLLGDVDIHTVRADEVLRKWAVTILQSLRSSPAPATEVRQITDFSELKDCEVYLTLLGKMVPTDKSLQDATTGSYVEKARAVLNAARQIACDPLASPEDIAKGKPLLNAAFLANLFNRCAAAVDEKELQKLRTVDIAETEEREEKALRSWINSLHLTESVGYLFTDERIRDGKVLLMVVEHLYPGAVNWRNYKDTPKKTVWDKVSACNYMLEVAEKNGLHMVNVGGTDVAEGKRKLILAIIWQLRKQATFNMLRGIKLPGGNGEDITDEYVLNWANQRVAECGKDTRIKGFKDSAFKRTAFLIDLLAAVSPTAVEYSLVDRNQTEESYASNAQYMITAAWRAGVDAVLLWEDIYSVNAKMLLTLVAQLLIFWNVHSSGEKEGINVDGGAAG
mmetsp:Transcript_10591/g.17971  ORF Transcript_10591/g.17971 Transcript_10591/m.17971 type:complete len:457 (-) Transcript_10591:251-1621(-)